MMALMSAMPAVVMRIEMIQLAVGLLRDNRRDRCLALRRTGRKKDEVGNAAALDDAAQKSVFPRRCCCPTTSSSVFGRILSAKG